MILVIGGEKGGTGKTTFSTNLAAIQAREAGDRGLLLVNTDSQNTAGYWAAMRAKTHPDLPKVHCVTVTGDNTALELVDLAKRYHTVIVDAGGRDSIELRSALTVSSVLVTPLKASSFDTWTLKTLHSLIGQVKAINPKIVTLVGVNQVHHSLVDRARADFQHMLADLPLLRQLQTVTVSRAAYANAAGEGLAVTEMKKSRDPKAVTEMLRLHEEVFNAAQAASRAA